MDLQRAEQNGLNRLSTAQGTGLPQVGHWTTRDGLAGRLSGFEVTVADRRTRCWSGGVQRLQNVSSESA